MTNMIFDEDYLKIERNYKITKWSSIGGAIISALVGFYLLASASGIQSNYLERNPYKNYPEVIECRKNPSTRKLRGESEDVKKYFQFNRCEMERAQTKKNLGICAFILSAGFGAGGTIFEGRLRKRKIENIEKVLENNFQ